MNFFKGAGLIKTCLKELAGQNLFLLIIGLVRNNAPAVLLLIMDLLETPPLQFKALNSTNMMECA